MRTTAARRGRWGLAVGGLALALVLAGCAEGSTPTVVNSAPSDPKAVSGTVKWWGWQSRTNIDGWIAAFNKSYPNVKIDYKYIDFTNYNASLRTGVASGGDSGPDVYNIAPGDLANRYGRFADDLTPLLTSSLGADWKNKISAQGAEAFTINEKMVAGPVGSGAAGTMVVNKTMLDGYGLQPPKTLQEWQQVCSTLKAKGKLCFVHGAKDAWINKDVFQAIMGDVAPGKFTDAIAGKVKWTDPAFVTGMGIWKDMFGNGIMQPGALGVAQYPDAQQKFLRQEAAMIAQGTWEMPLYTTAGMTGQLSSAGIKNPKPFTALYADFPDVTNGGEPRQLFAATDFGLALSAKSKAKTPAQALIAWLTMSPEGQQVVADGLLNIPSLAGIEPKPEALVDEAVQKASIADLIKKVQTAPEARYLPYADLDAALGDAQAAVASGGKTPEQALTDVEKVSSSLDR